MPIAYPTIINYSSNFTPSVTQARNQSQIFNQKLISRNTTLRRSCISASHANRWNVERL